MTDFHKQSAHEFAHSLDTVPIFKELWHQGAGEPSWRLEFCCRPHTFTTWFQHHWERL